MCVFSSVVKYFVNRMNDMGCLVYVTRRCYKGCIRVRLKWSNNEGVRMEVGKSLESVRVFEEFWPKTTSIGVGWYDLRIVCVFDCCDSFYKTYWISIKHVIDITRWLLCHRIRRGETPPRNRGFKW